MDISNLFKVYYDLATGTYHVNPFVFIILMVVSVPFYYWGWFRVMKVVYSFSKNFDRQKQKYLDILTLPEFFIPLTVNRAAWVAPYIYVVIWGRNLPFYFWLIFLGWIFFSTWFFWYKLKKEIKGKQ
jgi:hypothetical protein